LGRLGRAFLVLQPNDGLPIYLSTRGSEGYRSHLF
jgi:hypothetical protein